MQLRFYRLFLMYNVAVDCRLYTYKNKLNLVCFLFAYIKTIPYICSIKLRLNIKKNNVMTTENMLSEIKLKYNRVQLNQEGTILNSSNLVNKFIHNVIDAVDEDITLQEKFFAFFFDVRLNCVGYIKVSEGGYDSVMVDTRIIYTTALNTGALNVIICHNHPSTKVDPSNADISITNKIKEGLKTLDIRLIDHVIIEPTKRNYYSFADNGLI